MKHYDITFHLDDRASSPPGGRTYHLTACYRITCDPNKGESEATAIAWASSKCHRRFPDFAVVHVKVDPVITIKPPSSRMCASCGNPEDNHPYRHPFIPSSCKS